LPNQIEPGCRGRFQSARTRAAVLRSRGCGGLSAIYLDAVRRVIYIAASLLCGARCLSPPTTLDVSAFRANVRWQSRTSSKHKVFPQMDLSFGPRGEARKSAQKAAVAAVFHLSRDGWLQNVHFVPRLSMSFGRHLGARALTAHVAVLNFGATCGDGSGVESPQLRTRRRRPSADR
jgi:hypothetical protein